jgi:hypothetical protein
MAMTGVVVIVVLLIVAIVLDVVSSIWPEVVWIVVPIIDNVDIPDIDVVVGELVCCVAIVVTPIVVLVVVGIGVGGHVRGKQLSMHLDGAVEQSCWG